MNFDRSESRRFCGVGELVLRLDELRCLPAAAAAGKERFEAPDAAKLQAAWTVRIRSDWDGGFCGFVRGNGRKREPGRFENALELMRILSGGEEP